MAKPIPVDIAKQRANAITKELRTERNKNIINLAKEMLGIGKRKTNIKEGEVGTMRNRDLRQLKDLEY